MKTNRPLWPIFLIVAIGLVWQFGGRIWAPDAPLAKPDGPDLVSAFAQNDDRADAIRDAKSFAALCYALKRVVEIDAKLSQPRILTGVHIDDLRRWTREYQLDGKSLGSKYPKLIDEVRDYLNAKVGKDGGPLDDEQRHRWVEALETLGKCADYAASKG